MDSTAFPVLSITFSYFLCAVTPTPARRNMFEYLAVIRILLSTYYHHSSYFYHQGIIPHPNCNLRSMGTTTYGPTFTQDLPSPRVQSAGRTCLRRRLSRIHVQCYDHYLCYYCSQLSVHSQSIRTLVVPVNTNTTFDMYALYSFTGVAVDASHF